MIGSIATATNIYSVEKKGVSINVTSYEMRQYLGILIHTGIVNMPSYKSYWEAETRYDPIANAMSRRRFDEIKSNFHLVDNNDLRRGARPTTVANSNEAARRSDRLGSSQPAAVDKLFKFRPLYEHVLANCRAIEPEEHNSIDEQIVPYKGKSSSMRQYNPKKPTKWGFKFLTRCSADGLVYDFFLYSGGDTIEE